MKTISFNLFLSRVVTEERTNQKLQVSTLSPYHAQHKILKKNQTDKILKKKSKRRNGGKEKWWWKVDDGLVKLSLQVWVPGPVNRIRR